MFVWVSYNLLRNDCFILRAGCCRGFKSAGYNRPRKRSPLLTSRVCPFGKSGLRDSLAPLFFFSACAHIRDLSLFRDLIVAWWSKKYRWYARYFFFFMKVRDWFLFRVRRSTNEFFSFICATSVENNSLKKLYFLHFMDLLNYYVVVMGVNHAEMYITFKNALKFDKLIFDEHILWIIVTLRVVHCTLKYYSFWKVKIL